MNKIYLLRHGENLTNITKEFSSDRVNYPLTGKGELQAAQTGHYLKDKGIKAIYSSPLIRAVQTANIIGEILELEPIIMRAFQEFNVGDLENKPPNRENWALYHKITRAWSQGDREVAFPGGENYSQVWSMFEQGLQEAIHAFPDQTLLIVGHGGIFTVCMLDLCLGIDVSRLLRSDFHNTAITEVMVKLVQNRPVGKLVKWADASHLSGEAAELTPGVPHQDLLE